MVQHWHQTLHACIQHSRTDLARYSQLENPLPLRPAFLLPNDLAQPAHRQGPAQKQHVRCSKTLIEAKHGATPSHSNHAMWACTPFFAFNSCCSSRHQRHRRSRSRDRTTSLLSLLILSCSLHPMPRRLAGRRLSPHHPPCTAPLITIRRVPRLASRSAAFEAPTCPHLNKLPQSTSGRRLAFRSRGFNE